MRTIVKGKNLEVPEPVRRYVEQKMRRLDRVLDDRTDALVELSIEHRRNADVSHVVEATLVVEGRVLRGVGHAATHRAAVDQVVDKLERQTVDYKERPRVRARPVEEKAILRSLADGTADEARDGPRVVKTKRFAIEPMFEEDAIARMEELGHSFFVFVNAESEHVAVLYRRRDGDFGLIEPTVGGEYTTRRQRDGEGRGRRR